MISISRTVRIVNHCFTTRTTRTGRGREYTPKCRFLEDSLKEHIYPSFRAQSDKLQHETRRAHQVKKKKILLPSNYENLRSH